jgi:hypothetical protein
MTQQLPHHLHALNQLILCSVTRLNEQIILIFLQMMTEWKNTNHFGFMHAYESTRPQCQLTNRGCHLCHGNNDLF